MMAHLTFICSGCGQELPVRSAPLLRAFWRRLERVIGRYRAGEITAADGRAEITRLQRKLRADAGRHARVRRAVAGDLTTPTGPAPLLTGRV